jgi:oligoribonuclease (3'-5' exoribonuclease)
MRMVAIDIETTGLDPEQDQILEFGAIIFDPFDESVAAPSFQRYIIHDRIQGDAFALAMNGEILSRIAKPEEKYKYCSMEILGAHFFEFLIENDFPRTNKIKTIPTGGGFVSTRNALESITICGKNAASFDLQFLKRTKFIDYIPIKHRILDVGSLYFIPGDDVLPDLAKCMSRAGVIGDVEHNALSDCLNVIACVQNYYKERANG